MKVGKSSISGGDHYAQKIFFENFAALRQCGDLQFHNESESFFAAFHSFHNILRNCGYAVILHFISTITSSQVYYDEDEVAKNFGDYCGREKMLKYSRIKKLILLNKIFNFSQLLLEISKYF